MDKAGIGQLLRQLVAIDGPSGVEASVASLVADLDRDVATETRVDALGNVIALRRGAANPPGRILLAAHMDEIGLIVTRVEDSFLHVHEVGGLDPRALLGQEVTVYPTGPRTGQTFEVSETLKVFMDGKGLPGYIGGRPPHLTAAENRDRVIPLGDLRVDLGLPRAILESGLVQVGDRVAVRGPYTELLGGRVVSKALDNRASVAAMLGALGYLAAMQHSWDVYAVATVQEEIGLRGAITSAFEIAPDVASAIDVTFGATPGLNSAETVAMDKGPAIGWGPNLHPGVVSALRKAADAHEIPYVIEPLPGDSGTDAWAIQVAREGIPTGLTSIPIRYMHSATELVVLADIDRTARLLATFIGRLDDAFLASLPEEV